MTRTRGAAALRAVTDHLLRVVLYVRVSAIMGRAGDDFLSPDIQLAAMRARIGLAGMREVAVVDDDIDVTGTHFSRDGIDKIRAMAEARSVDAIAVYDVSRLGRNVLESLQFLAWLAKRGVTIISACEQIDTSTPAGELMLTNMLSIAQYRSKEIGRGWAAAIDARARAGRHHGHTYGYRRVNKALVPDPVIGPIVTWAFAAYATDMPIGQIAAEVARRRGQRTYTNRVKDWMRNPVYLGHVTAGGEIVARDAHQALVDQPTWDLVQQRLARDTGTPARHLEPTWAMVGLCYCPDGHRLQRMPTRYRGPVDRLICGLSSSRGVRGGCAGIGYPRLIPVEEEVLRQVREYLRLLRTDGPARAAQMARRAQAGANRADLQHELARTRTAIAKLSKGWALGDVPDSGYHQPMAELRAAEHELARQLDAEKPAAVVQTPTEAADAVALMLTLWPDATVAERGRMLRDVVSRVVVRRAAFWREPECDRVEVAFR